jgi:hypothetical protein
VSFSPDGTQVLSSGTDETLRLWDVKTGTELRTFRGHASVVVAGAFAPDGRTVLSGSLDGTMRLWEVGTARSLVTLVGFRDGEWIALTPEGYYNASENGDEYITVRIGTRVYGIARFRPTFFRPSVVDAALAMYKASLLSVAPIQQPGDNVPDTWTLTRAADIEPPRLTLLSPQDGAVLSSLKTTLVVRAEDRHRPIHSIRVYVNGTRMSEDARNGLSVWTGSDRVPAGLAVASKEQSVQLEIPLQLEEGKNIVEVVAFNGFTEERAMLRLTTAHPVNHPVSQSSLPALWILAVGVTTYNEPGIASVPYASSDAETVVGMMRRQQGKLFGEIHPILLTSTTAAKPTSENIRSSLAEIRRQVQPRDTVVLLMVGQGINDERGDYAFLAGDAAMTQEGNHPLSGSVSWKDLLPLLNLPSKKIILLDSCYWKRNDPADAIAVNYHRLVKRVQEFNVVLLSSCRGLERAENQAETLLDQGMFAHVLLRGLRGKADADHDQRVTLGELDGYLTDSLPQLTNGAQHPITHTPEGYLETTIAVVE